MTHQASELPKPLRDDPVIAVCAERDAAMRLHRAHAGLAVAVMQALSAGAAYAQVSSNSLKANTGRRGSLAGTHLKVQCRRRVCG
jgi:hypothetical protein